MVSNLATHYALAKYKQTNTPVQINDGTDLATVLGDAVPKQLSETQLVGFINTQRQRTGNLAFPDANTNIGALPSSASSPLSSLSGNGTAPLVWYPEVKLGNGTTQPGGGSGARGGYVNRSTPS